MKGSEGIEKLLTSVVLKSKHNRIRNKRSRSLVLTRRRQQFWNTHGNEQWVGCGQSREEAVGQVSRNGELRHLAAGV